MDRDPPDTHLGVGQKRELLASVITRLTEFVFVLLDVDGRFISWHPGVKTTFGYSEEEFLGRHLKILYVPEEQVNGAVNKELDVAAKEGRASDTRWLAKKNGERVYVDGLTISLHDADGQLIGFGKVIHDVTRRRKAEEGLSRLARALDQSTVILRHWDGTIDHWTDGCERLYGWSKEEVLGKPIQGLLQTRFEKSRDSIHEQLLAKGEWKGKVSQTGRDGTVLQVMMSWVLLPGQSPDLSAVIETHTDVTYLMEMRQAVEDANKRLENLATELERSNRELEEFARITSHDLSAPIISTRWLLDLTISRYKDRLKDAGLESLQQASANLERMLDLIEAVLKHSRVGRNAIRSAAPVSSEAALQSALANLSVEIQRCGAEITHAPLPDVHVSAEPLSQLFQNLVSNAIKYSRPEVTPKLHIEVTGGPEAWRFSFRDNGIGIGPQYHERIFQPMQRLHGHDVPGSGIGLATCKKIVERAGGSISVESTEGQGATFLVTLP
ncbi:MAG: ATP-binding protein [Bryobacteraceae bacterium]